MNRVLWSMVIIWRFGMVSCTLLYYMQYSTIHYYMTWWFVCYSMIEALFLYVCYSILFIAAFEYILMGRVFVQMMNERISSRKRVFCVQGFESSLSWVWYLIAICCYATQGCINKCLGVLLTCTNVATLLNAHSNNKWQHVMYPKDISQDAFDIPQK